MIWVMRVELNGLRYSLSYFLCNKVLDTAVGKRYNMLRNVKKTQNKFFAGDMIIYLEKFLLRKPKGIYSNSTGITKRILQI